MKAFTILIALLSVKNSFPIAIPVPEERIVGGSEASISDFPYQLSLRVNGRHTCGASVIAPQWALTAAHCLINAQAADINLRAGSTTYTSGGVLIQAAQIFSHPNFNAQNGDYDVALINTASQLNGEDIEPIALPAASAPIPTGGVATISGWGLTSSSTSMNPIDLQFVTVTIISQDQCNIDYGSFGGVDNVLFCAGGAGKDSCQGDSGGPIVLSETQIGIVSGGIGCAHPQYPGLYTRIADPTVRNWISSTANV